MVLKTYTKSKILQVAGPFFTNDGIDKFSGRIFLSLDQSAGIGDALPS